MKKSQIPQQPAPPAERRPGAFRGDGSWNEDGQLSDRGPMHQLVAALIRRRREGTLTPALAAEVIEAANATAAFPYWQRWRECESWPSVLTASSAEEAVKRCGHGIEGHWCGEQWDAGAEKDCTDPRHHMRPSQEQVDQHVAQMVAKLAEPTPWRPPAPEHRNPSDENYFGGNP